MDIQDVSYDSFYTAHLQKMVAIARQAALRKGEKPDDHPPAWLLKQSFMMRLQMSQYGGVVGAGQNLLATSQIPEPYLPCILPLSSLKPMVILQMALETHHRGYRTLVRVLTPPVRMTAVMAVIEDTEGTATLLQLYHQPPEDVVPCTAIIKPGNLFMLKEPFFKSTSDGKYSLRVDHPSDLIPVDETHELVPAKWKKNNKATTTADESQKLRSQGNNAVGKKEWAEAEQLYSLAIKTAQTPDEEQLALLNRSLANLRLGRPASARADAAKASSISGPNEKALFREASALYELRKFDDCMAKLDELVDAFPSTEAAGSLNARVRARLQEQRTGVYDFGNMRKQAQQNMPPVIDCATYSAPVEIREAAGKGRGLFTTRKVLAGELLLCEKALGYCYDGEDKPGPRCTTILMNLSTKRAAMGGQADLLTQLVQKFYHDPEAARAFAGMCHGDYKSVASDKEVDGKPVVDTFLVEKIMSLTAFGSPKQSKLVAFDEEHEKRRSYGTTGVYSLAGCINHSCISNARRSFIGDVQIVRATRDLEPDTEILFWYQGPDEYESYNEAQKRLRSWGFACACEMCLARKKTSAQTIRRREVLRGELRKAMGGRLKVNKARKVLAELEDTYSATEKAPGGVRFELWDPYIALGHWLAGMGKAADAIEVLVRGLEALGFIIVATHPGKGTKPEFCVKQWGIAVDYCVHAFYALLRAYEALYPELSTVVKDYAETAVSMVVGDKEMVTYLYLKLCGAH